MKHYWVGVLLGAYLGFVQGCGGDGSGDEGDDFSGPALRTSRAALDEALHCTPFENPDKPVVLLVHGTVTTGTEQYTVFYTPLLVERGFDVCAVTYPDRGLGDQQISAEYVVNALRRIHERTGREVAMIGHSQGASMPRWALKFWPSARTVVRDFVLIAGPNHGTTVALPARLGESLSNLLAPEDFPLPAGFAPEAFFQFARDSKFNAAVNAGDETPGDIDYTTLYTTYDELVRPVSPVPTAALDFGENNPNVSNILMQNVCGPQYLTEHLAIGTTDPVAFELALDAISNPGPADVARAGGTDLCSLLPIDLASLARPENATALLEILADDLQTGPPDPHLASGEPELQPYARGEVE